MSEIFSRIYDKQSDALTAHEVGAEGERLATDYLKHCGYRLVCANFKTPVGRNRLGAVVTGEIDLIAYDENKLCFVEVKTRTSEEFASPLAAVDLRKQRQIIRTARVYRRIFRLQKAAARFDVITIILGGNTRPKIELFKGYFNELRFHKKFFADEN